MPVVTIKNMPFELHSHLKKEASVEGRSLNSYVPAVLTAFAEERARLRRMQGSSGELEALVVSLPPSDNVMELIRERTGTAAERAASMVGRLAAASVAEVDLVVSWSFKHIVHFDKIAGFGAVNLLHGYKPLRIHSPQEVVEL